MGWSCGACTFVNANESASCCDVCQTRRRAQSALSKGGKTSQQLTLFGTVAVDSKKKGGNVRKQKDEKKVHDQSPQRKPNPSLASETSTMGMVFPPRATSQASLRTLDLPLSTLLTRSETIMKDVFKIPELRFLQPQAVRFALQKKSQIVVMATGGGKSLCYQLPAVVRGGTTIVISPLIALIADQVEALQRKGIDAAFLSGSLSEGKKKDLFERLLRRSLRETKPKNSIDFKSQPPITLLYSTPEQVKTDRFRSMLKELHDQNRLTSFAIDEAHSISEWGHQFRPAFLQLSWLRENFKDVPLLATTATATKRVLEDIRKILLFGNDVATHIGSFDRVNITYQVRYKDALEISNPSGGAAGDLIKFVMAQHNNGGEGVATPCSGIIYVHKQQDTLDLSRQITKESGIRALPYHGGMKDAERLHTQKEWMSGRAPIAVATIAFGMGIDLATVRYVVHWSVSKTIENFYQESGRAGRDGLPSKSVVYFSREEINRFRFLAGKSKTPAGAERSLNGLEKMTDYCLKAGCRRQYLLKFFGEKETDPLTVCRGKCDYCRDPKAVTQSIEAASAYHDFSFHTSSVPYGQDDDGLFGGGEYEEEGFDAPGAGETENKKGGKLLDTLRKHEIKASDGRSSGFVQFKSRARDDGKVEMEEAKLSHKMVVIPEHLRKNAPDPLQHFERKSETTKKSSDLADDAARLREELAELQAAREEMLRARAKSSRPPPPPPPPPTMPSTKRRRR